MATVVRTDLASVSWAVKDAGLIASAGNIIQPYGPRPLAEARRLPGCSGSAEAQLPAHHIGVHEVPGVIAYGPPLAVDVQLHTALANVASIHQPNTWMNSATAQGVRRLLIALSARV
eukprot:9158776-Pyramimonas_sp.AAC.1